MRWKKSESPKKAAAATAAFSLLRIVRIDVRPALRIFPEKDVDDLLRRQIHELHDLAHIAQRHVVAHTRPPVQIDLMEPLQSDPPFVHMVDRIVFDPKGFCDIIKLQPFFFPDFVKVIHSHFVAYLSYLKKFLAFSLPPWYNPIGKGVINMTFDIFYRDLDEQPKAPDFPLSVEQYVVDRRDLVADIPKNNENISQNAIVILEDINDCFQHLEIEVPGSVPLRQA
nr:MAG TPA: hypothetical protein [Caudoviricetes sp.]